MEVQKRESALVMCASHWGLSRVREQKLKTQIDVVVMLLV